MSGLFASEVRDLVDDGHSWVRHYPAWLQEAEHVLARLEREVVCQRAQIRMFGKTVTIPRLQAWFGDPGASYRYSGVRLQPDPWTPALSELRQTLHTRLPGSRFNSVLVNLYRDGQDTVGWHSDDERDLGPEPLIASLSLGHTRRFQLKPKNAARGAGIGLDLAAGDLLLMGGQTQTHYAHCAPRTQRPVGPRWNLTFRWIQGPQ